MCSEGRFGAGSPLCLLRPDSHAYLAARGALTTLKSLLDVVLLAGY